MGLDEYERHLRECGFSQRTVGSYLWVAEFFLDKHGEASPVALADYKEWLGERYKPNTVNQRIQALNYYLGYVGKDDLRLKPVSVKKTDADPSIDYASYRRLVRYLRGEEYWRDYHAIRLMVTSGLRVGELLGLEVGDMRRGYADVCEGKAARRVRFLDAVAKAALGWAEGEGRSKGLLFLNRFGAPSRHVALPTSSRKGPWSARGGRRPRASSGVQEPLRAMLPRSGGRCAVSGRAPRVADRLTSCVRGASACRWAFGA